MGVIPAKVQMRRFGSLMTQRVSEYIHWSRLLKPIFFVAAQRPSTMASNQQLEELNGQLMESKLTIEGLEKERDFYFGKLRDIEVLCQEMEGSEYAQKILAVLYATEDGFAVPDDEEIPPPPEDEEY